ncbi:MAG: MarR family EPS-associated transcriptional regulator [Deltaproteobacteria bacterium]|nr:MarR family EPS-associated transcriptional regulator [Deltaproteobacteria bacterium]
MEPSQKDFPILDALGRKTISTQRDLADHAGISLGQVNYVLKSFLERGLVKITNFTNSPKRIGYIYRLTPKGLEAKSALAAKFFMQKLKEYGDIKEKLAERLGTFESEKHFRIFFVGPSLVGDLIGDVIKEKELSLMLVGQCRVFENLKDYDADFFDVVLLFEGNGKSLVKSAKTVNIPSKKLIPFW